MPPAFGTVAELAAQVITHATNGDLVRADQVVALALELAGDEVELDVAALWYAIAVAEHVRGDLDGQVLAAERCLALARRLQSPGWASNALSMRAMARARGNGVDAALVDAAASEVELEQCDDPALRAWAHTGIGYCYDQMRLYELALPHFEAAERYDVSPVPLPESKVIDQRNLADLHLRWADELERVVHPGAATEQVGEQRRLGRRWALRAAATAYEQGLDGYLRSCELMHLCALADTDPAGVLDPIRRALDNGEGLTVGGERVRLGTALARALWSTGRHDEAVEAARAAVQASSAPMDWQLTIAARHQLVELEAAHGVHGAADGRDYARLLNDALWQQRLRTLQGARSAVELERLQRSHALATAAARQDPLTGLGNRRLLDEAVIALAAGSGDRRHHSLVLVDLDGFKAVNDAHGHLVGDAVLCAVADALRASARAEDVIVRLGGDEFVVLAGGADALVGAELARRIRAGVDDTAWQAIAVDLRVSVSVGVATTGDGTGLADLVRAADAAMYAVKPRGDGRGRPAGSAHGQGVRGVDVGST